MMGKFGGRGGGLWSSLVYGIWHMAYIPDIWLIYTSWVLGDLII